MELSYKPAGAVTTEMVHHVIIMIVLSAVMTM